MKAGVEGGKLVVPLTSFEEAIISKTLPFFTAYLSVIITSYTAMCMALVIHGEEAVKPYLDRLSRGESTDEVVKDITRELGISTEQLMKAVDRIDASNLDIENLLWGKGNEQGTD